MYEYYEYGYHRHHRHHGHHRGKCYYDRMMEQYQEGMEFQRSLAEAFSITPRDYTQDLREIYQKMTPGSIRL